MINMKNASFNTVEDLLASESFMGWYNRNNEEDIQIWNRWITASHHNHQLANEAIRFLKGIQVKEEYIPDEQIENQLLHILDRIKNEPGPSNNTANKQRYV